MKDLESLFVYTNVFAEQLAVRPDIHMDDFIFRFVIDNPIFDSVEAACRYYFFDGRQSAQNLSGVLQELGPRFQDKVSMLEFASGYGCVTRHLRTALPKVSSTACDIHENAVRFIGDKLEERAIISHTQPRSFAPADKYDVIFSLSFFSHMPRETWGDWIAAHFGCLNPGGALIFTTHGQVSRTKHFGSPEMPADGFWFKPTSEQHDLPTSDYGQTIVTKDFVEAEIYRKIDRPISIYKEGFWWNHQDIFVVLN